MLCESVAGSFGIGFERGHGEMARHDRAHARGDGGAEGNEFDAFEFGAVAGNGGEREMRIDADVAVAGKMLGGGERAVFLHAANELGDVLGDALRIFAERADVDDRIVGIIVDVRVRRENPVHAGRRALRAP